MKKSISKILALSMMLVSMTGCVSEPPPATTNTTTPDPTPTTPSVGNDTEIVETVELVPEDGASLVYWTHRPDFGKAMAEKFEAEYGVSVTVEEVGFDSISKLSLEGPAGNAADIVWGSHSDVVTGYNSGIFMQVDPNIQSTLQNELQQAAVDAVTRDGNMYGYPMSIETVALVYNKDLVETPASTFEEIAEACEEWNDPANNMFYYGNTIGGYSQYPLVSAGGFQLHGANGLDNDNPGYDSPEFIKGLENIALMGQMFPVKASNIRMDGVTFTEQNFIQGKTVYLQTGPWAMKSLTESGVNFGVIPHPTIGGNDAISMGGLAVNYVSSFTKYPIAAQMFASYLVSAEGAAELYANNGDITSRADYKTIEGLKDDVNLLIFAEQFENCIAQPSVSRMNYYWTISDAIYGAVHDGDLTPEEGAAKAQADFEALVASE